MSFILYRTRKLGGLGLTNVNCKAKALLIKSFLETSVMSNCTHNLYHEALFRWYVEDNRDISQPTLPPYYDQSFFDIIREVKLEGRLNVSKMSTRQWYRVLLEKLVTHQTVNSVSVLRPMKVEINLPNVNWERSWAMLNCGGLPSLETSFLWRMINNLLPVPTRLYRMKMANATTDLCTLCNEGRVGDLNHCLLKCSFNREASLFLIQEVSKLAKVNSDDCFIYLDVDAGQEQFAVTFLIGHILSSIWRCRQEKKKCSIISVRASLEASINILRKSRHAGMIGALQKF